MAGKKQENEIEAKFCVLSFDEIERRLLEIGGLLTKPRHHERNLRFDTPQHELTRNHRVLRLRQDKNIHLTFKGPAEHVGGISKRREIEFQADDFLSAKKFLRALGYDISVIYEKHRTAYQLDNFENNI